MKEFIIKTIKHIFISLVLVNILILAFIKLYPEYFITDFGDYVVLTNQYQRIQTSKNCKNVIIGDSRANVAFKTSLINHRYNNLAIPGSTFIEGFFTVRKLMENSNIDTIVCCYGNSYLESEGWFDRRTLKLGQDLMLFSDLIEIQYSEKKVNKLIHWKESAERILTYLHLPYFFRSNFFNNILKIFQNKKSNFILEKVKFDKGNFYFEQQDIKKNLEIKKDNDNTSLSKMKFHPVVDHYKNKLLELCRNKNVVLIFVFPPTFVDNEFYVQNYFRDELIKSGVKVIQYPIFPIKLFSDQSHLNEKGSVEFMSKFSNSINAF
jgi:hypothetical protein